MQPISESDVRIARRRNPRDEWRRCRCERTSLDPSTEASVTASLGTP
jgi:hypothetical protein